MYGKGMGVDGLYILLSLMLKKKMAYYGELEANSLGSFQFTITATKRSGIYQALLFLYHIQANSLPVHPSSHGHSLYVQIANQDKITFPLLNSNCHSSIDFDSFHPHWL